MLPTNIKSDFPIFDNHPDLCYLDSAATSQKPKGVMERMKKFYESENANIHRGLYDLSEKATQLYEGARQTVADFIGAKSDEIIFTKNATEGINLIAHSFGDNLPKNSTILLTWLEHHANIVPWHLLQKRRPDIKIEVVEIDDDGTLDMNDLDEKLSKRPALLGITYISNAIGTINPIDEIVKKAQAVGTKVLVDGSQAVPHLAVDMKIIGADFFVFTGHKMLGPTGIGVLYVKKNILENLPPFLGGGDMINHVSFSKTEFLPAPQRFEAGTPPICEAIGLAEAIEYLKKLGMDKIRAHEKNLFNVFWKELVKIAGVKLYGPAEADKHAGIISFTIDGVHPHDISEIFNSQKIAIRAGQHCAEPLISRLSDGATARLSFYLYSGEDEAERVVAAIFKVKKVFA